MGIRNTVEDKFQRNLTLFLCPRIPELWDMYRVYILYSRAKDSYYIGQTMDLESRIFEHNFHRYQGAETRKATDWELFYAIKCESRTQAILIERHIKKMKSRSYIQNLKKYSDITEKLLQKYKS